MGVAVVPTTLLSVSTPLFVRQTIEKGSPMDDRPRRCRNTVVNINLLPFHYRSGEDGRGLRLAVQANSDTSFIWSPSQERGISDCPAGRRKEIVQRIHSCVGRRRDATATVFRGRDEAKKVVRLRPPCLTESLLAPKMY